MDINKRKFLKQIGLGSLGISPALVEVSDAKTETHDKTAIEIAVNSTYPLTFFTAANEELDINLFLGVGMNSIDDTAEKIIQVSEDKKILNIEWITPTKLQFWESGDIYNIKVSPNGEIKDEKKVKENVVPLEENGNKQKIEQESDSGYTPPPGGGGGADWTEIEHEPVTKCSSSNIGDVCVGTGDIGLKFYANCGGGEIPLIGGYISAASIEWNGTGFSQQVGFWFGYHPPSNCLYFGSDIFNFCESTCGWSATPTYQEVENKVEDKLSSHSSGLVADLQAATGSISVGQALGALFIIAVLLIVLYVLKLPVLPVGPAA